MDKRIKIFLKAGKEQSVKRLHPWVFSGAIAKTEGEPQEGDLVDVFSSDREFLGTGHFQPSSIMVRILSFHRNTIDEQFWTDRFLSAYALREELGLINNPNTNLYRLIHGEGDSLPGLIVDIYNKTAVIQCHSVGMWRNIALFTSLLKKLYGNRLTAVYDKSSETLPFMAGIENVDGFLFGEQTDHLARENGLQFHVDWQKGQKTGFFIDQRENRQLLEHYSKGKDVLNMFCYTGGFSFYAMRGNAKSVHSVDSSARAIDITNKNVELNFDDDTRHEAFAVDAFKFLDNIEDKYDLIVLDPPAFAKHRKVLQNAIQGYKKINAKAIKQIRKGGIIFTFSCSQAVSRDEFKKTVFVAAAQSGRKVRILHQLMQPADHPINIFHPESEYLKGLVLKVD